MTIIPYLEVFGHFVMWVSGMLVIFIAWFLLGYAFKNKTACSIINQVIFLTLAVLYTWYIWKDGIRLYI